ncbi:MAG: HDOD domain-containing protein [Kiritimatiellae bacterium]|nr:HDOD domain-containing protein [Kiritimatiellia bacterium]MDD4735429.1 HDOD domain-containing protein [Kiritimatiellia bacterium]
MLAKIIRLKKLVKSLRNERLFTVPSVLTELLRISRDPLADASDLAQIAERDPTISARLLKTSNSAYYGKANHVPVDNITDAIVRLGFRKSEEVIMSATVCAALVTHRSSAEFSMWELWRHSYAVGICNRMLSTRVFDRPDFDPFLAGLLHDIGIIVENQFFYDDGFFRATEARHTNESLLTEEEERFIGLTHEEIGEAVARDWNIPEHIVAVIGHHHKMEEVNPRLRHLLHCTRVSEWICFILKLGYCDFSQPHADELIQSRSFLKLSDADLEVVASGLEEEMKILSGIGWFPYASYRAA